MIGRESESKEEIKIHERFEQRRIKIHDGIIVDSSKTKACDSNTRESFTARVSRSRIDFLWQRSRFPIYYLYNKISYFLHLTFVLLPLVFLLVFNSYTLMSYRFENFLFVHSVREQLE